MKPLLLILALVLSGCGVNRVIVRECQPVPYTDESVCEKVRDL
jgi:hypothetical protein